VKVALWRIGDNISRRHSCYNSVYVMIVVRFSQEYR
jgi:hypothetical protein